MFLNTKSLGTLFSTVCQNIDKHVSFLPATKESFEDKATALPKPQKNEECPVTLETAMAFMTETEMGPTSFGK